MDVLLSKVFLNFSLVGLTKDFLQVSCPVLKKKNCASLFECIDCY